MLKRIITAVVGIPLALAIMYTGGIFLALAAAFGPAADPPMTTMRFLSTSAVMITLPDY